MNRSMLCVFVVTMLTLAGCKKEETSAPESAHAATPSQTASPDQPSAGELPVAEDFEAEAERVITEDNYGAMGTGVGAFTPDEFRVAVWGSDAVEN